MVTDCIVWQAWRTNLEAGIWYEIADRARPRVTLGFVFVPAHGDIDYRESDGRKLSLRKEGSAEMVRAWEAAVSEHNRETKRKAVPGS